uniref:Uncharacterized protein n=1 Tax=Oncorhynchus kisutch TaxID=8019 RepID=A0A8C7HYD8_ONCKI
LLSRLLRLLMTLDVGLCLPGVVSLLASFLLSALGLWSSLQLPTWSCLSPNCPIPQYLYLPQTTPNQKPDPGRACQDMFMSPIHTPQSLLSISLQSCLPPRQTPLLSEMPLGRQSVTLQEEMGAAPIERKEVAHLFWDVRCITGLKGEHFYLANLGLCSKGEFRPFLCTFLSMRIQTLNLSM